MIGRKSTLIAMNTIGGGLLGLIAIKAIGYWIEPGFLGQFAYAFAVLGTLSFVTDLGLGAAHGKRVSEGGNESDLFATFLGFKVVATAVFVVIALGLFWYRYAYTGKGFEDLSATAYLVFTAYFALMGVRTLFQNTFDARRETARAQAVLFTDTIFRVLAVVVVTFVYAAIAKSQGPLVGVVDPEWTWARLIAEYPAGAIAMTWLVGMVVSVMASVWHWRRSAVRIGSFSWSIMRDYWAFALPLFLLGVASSLSGYIDRMALGLFGTDVDVGVFDPIKRFSIAIEAIPLAVATLLFPSVSRMQAQGEEHLVRDATERSLRYVSMIVLPMVVFTALFPLTLVRIFVSESYSAGATALSLLVVYAFVVGLQRPYYSVITGLGHSRVTARVGITMAVSNVVLNILLIPDDIKALGLDLPGLKVTGAAIATLASGVIGYAMLQWETKRILGRVRVPDFFRQLLAAAVMGLLLVGANAVPALALDRWYDFVAYTGVGALVYFGLLTALRGFTRSDLELFLDVANVREMWRYVRGELFARDK